MASQHTETTKVVAVCRLFLCYIPIFKIGRMIVEEEQNGQDRAEYGKYILKELLSHLRSEFGKGFFGHTLLTKVS